MPRHNFSPKTKREARARSGGFCEAVGTVYGLDAGLRCNVPLAKGVEFDHYPIPATDKGSDTLDNCVACCPTCHGHKTATYDIPMQAKGKRVSDRHLGIKRPSRLRSRNTFQPRPDTTRYLDCHEEEDAMTNTTIDEPPQRPQCRYCDDTGWIVIRSSDGSYAFSGAVPDDLSGYTDADCWFCDRGPPPCSTCRGTSKLDERLGGVSTSGIVPCPDCSRGVVQ